MLLFMEEAVLHWSGKSVKFQLLILIYSCELLMIIGPTAAWSVPPPLMHACI